MAAPKRTELAARFNEASLLVEGGGIGFRDSCRQSGLSQIREDRAAEALGLREAVWSINSEKTLRDWRATALCFAAAMTATGDL